MDLLQNNPEPELIHSVYPVITQEDEIYSYVNMINSSHKSVQLEGVIGIRKLLSVNQARKKFSLPYPENINHFVAPIQKVIDTNIVPKLLEIMTWEDEYKFQVILALPIIF